MDMNAEEGEAQEVRDNKSSKKTKPAGHYNLGPSLSNPDVSTPGEEVPAVHQGTIRLVNRDLSKFSIDEQLAVAAHNHKGLRLRRKHSRSRAEEM